jgi:hypothetical protein
MAYSMVVNQNTCAANIIGYPQSKLWETEADHI